MEHDAILFVCGMLATGLLGAISDHMYRNTLILKSKLHEVEFINGEPIVLVPEKDYIEMVFKEPSDRL